jgi:hypothetical protein
MRELRKIKQQSAHWINNKKTPCPLCLWGVY